MEKSEENSFSDYLQRIIYYLPATIDLKISINKKYCLFLQYKF